MYIPKNLQMSGKDAVANFISEFGFGLLISKDLEATQLPLLYDPNEGEFGCIIGHMARSNPQWRGLEGSRVSAMFSGPHAYISPTWYASKPAVPTWNYASVQCFGSFVQLDSEQTLNAINLLVAKYEPELGDNQQLMQKDYVDRLLKAVVGFKILVDEIHAKEKLGQHKPAEDQQGVFQALCNSNDTDALQLAEYMKKRRVGIGF